MNRLWECFYSSVSDSTHWWYGEWNRWTSAGVWGEKPQTVSTHRLFLLTHTHAFIPLILNTLRLVAMAAENRHDSPSFTCSVTWRTHTHTHISSQGERFSLCPSVYGQRLSLHVVSRETLRVKYWSLISATSQRVIGLLMEENGSRLKLTSECCLVSD